MGIENHKNKREDITQVTRDEHDNAVRYGELQEAANDENEGFDEAKSWTIKNKVLVHIENDPFAFIGLVGKMPPEFWSDKEIVSKVVARFGPNALKHASQALQEDKEILEIAHNWKPEKYNNI